MLKMIQKYLDNQASTPSLKLYVRISKGYPYYNYKDFQDRLENEVKEDLKTKGFDYKVWLARIRVFIDRIKTDAGIDFFTKEKILHAARFVFFEIIKAQNISLVEALEVSENRYQNLSKLPTQNMQNLGSTPGPQVQQETKNIPRRKIKIADRIQVPDRVLLKLEDKPTTFGLFTLGTKEKFAPGKRKNGTPESKIKNTTVTQFFLYCTSPCAIIDGVEIYSLSTPTRTIEQGEDYPVFQQEDALREALMHNPFLLETTSFSNSKGGAIASQKFFQKLYEAAKAAEKAHQPVLLPPIIRFSKVDDPASGFKRKAEARKTPLPPNVQHTLTPVVTDELRHEFSEQSTATGRGKSGGLSPENWWNHWRNPTGPLQSIVVMPFPGTHTSLFHGYAGRVNSALIINYSLTYDTLTKQGLTFSQIPPVVDREDEKKVIHSFQENTRYSDVLKEYQKIWGKDSGEYKEIAKKQLKTSGWSTFSNFFKTRSRVFAATASDHVRYPEIFWNDYEEFAFAQAYPKLHNYLFNRGLKNTQSEDKEVKNGFNQPGGYTEDEVKHELKNLQNSHPELYSRLNKTKIIATSKMPDLLMGTGKTPTDQFIDFALAQFREVWFESGRKLKKNKYVLTPKDVIDTIIAINRQDISDAAKQQSICTKLSEYAAKSDLNDKLRQTLNETLFGSLAQHSDHQVREMTWELRKFWIEKNKMNKDAELLLRVILANTQGKKVNWHNIYLAASKLRADAWFWEEKLKKTLDTIIIYSIEKSVPRTPLSISVKSSSHGRIGQHIGTPKKTPETQEPIANVVTPKSSATPTHRTAQNDSNYVNTKNRTLRG